MRNSSLVECARADNVARLKHRTDAVDTCFVSSPVEEAEGAGYGRGAFCAAEKPDREDRWSAQKSECRNE